MYKYILEGAGNINWMAIFALLTFLFIFLVSVVVVFSRNKAFIDKMAHMPLDDNQSLHSEIPAHHEH